METFIRFQTRLRCGNTGRPAGLFVAAGRLEESAHLAPWRRELLCEHLAWFNQKLTVPSLDGKGWRCLFWYRSTATAFIDRMWDLIAILREEGVAVQKRWTEKPGMIVYQDRVQIGAVPEKRCVALHR